MSTIFRLVLLIAFLLPSCRTPAANTDVKTYYTPLDEETSVLHVVYRGMHAKSDFDHLPEGERPTSPRTILAEDLSFFKCGYEDGRKPDSLFCEMMIVDGKIGRSKNAIRAGSSLSKAFTDDYLLSQEVDRSGSQAKLDIVSLIKCKYELEGWDCNVSFSEDDKKKAKIKKINLKDYYEKKENSDMKKLIKLHRRMRFGER